MALLNFQFGRTPMQQLAFEQAERDRMREQSEQASTELGLQRALGGFAGLPTGPTTEQNAGFGVTVPGVGEAGTAPIAEQSPADQARTLALLGRGDFNPQAQDFFNRLAGPLTEAESESQRLALATAEQDLANSELTGQLTQGQIDQLPLAKELTEARIRASNAARLKDLDANRLAKEKRAIDIENGIRSELNADPQVGNFETMLGSANRIKSLLRVENPIAALGVINQLARIYDPGSVNRPSEVAAAQAAFPFIERIQNALEQAKGGGFTEDSKKLVTDAVDAMMGSMVPLVRPVLEQAVGRAVYNGVDVFNSTAGLPFNLDTLNEWEQAGDTATGNIDFGMVVEEEPARPLPNVFDPTQPF